MIITEEIPKYVWVIWGVVLPIGWMCFVAYIAILMKGMKKRGKNHESRYTHRKPGD